MAKENSILQEAILEAKQVREAAISQAYESLKENLTPAIKTMLENKLEEELKLEESTEEDLEESAANSGFKEVKVSAPKAEKIEEAEESDSEEEEAEDATDDAEDAKESAEDAEKDADEAEEEAEEAEEEKETEEKDKEDEESESEMDDETKIEDLTVGDLKDLIANIISQSSVPAEIAPEGEMGADMEVADVEGAGEEGAAVDVSPADATADADNADVEVDDEEDGDEIDLAELLKELEDENESNVQENEIVPTDKRGKQHDKKVGDGKCQDGETEDIDESKDEKIKNLEEGLKKITETLKNVNLTNSKLQYTTRILSEHNLSEAQKATVIRTLDKAKTTKEVKIIYNTLVESLGNAKSRILQEHRGSASRAAGSSTRNNIVDADETVRRMQYLAGIIS